MSALTRREVMNAGLSGFLTVNLSLAGFRKPIAPGRARARSVILIWLDGGPSQFDTFDPKPNAPSGIKSEFGAIRTKVPGLNICELMPRMARQMGRCTLIRTVSHDEPTHERACHLALTGQKPDSAVVYPSLGSVVARDSARAQSIPPYVSIAGDTFGFGFGRSGCLKSAFDPFSVAGTAAEPQVHSRFPQLEIPLDLDKEPVAMHDRYGRHAFGQRCLLARRLVESGTRFVTVSQSGWDTHCDNAVATRDWLVPPLDQGMAALIEDLHYRGLLEETLVVCMGEFGRSPKINPLGGRDHWSQAGFALFAGAGVPRGQVVGATDSRGAEPVDCRVSPQDIAVTIYTKLGIDHHQSYRTPDKDTVRILEGGEYIQELG